MCKGGPDYLYILCSMLLIIKLWYVFRSRVSLPANPDLMFAAFQESRVIKLAVD